MFEKIEEKGRLLGYRLQHKHVMFFFGSRHTSRDNLYDLHPEFEFTFTKQVHGNQAVKATADREVDADAQYSHRVTRAPVVITADCAPVLLASKSQVCAVHAGWRSTAGGIIKNCAKVMNGDPVLFAAIGPHIGRHSFEVGRDVATQLLASLPEGCASEALQLPHPDSQKVFFDLNTLIREQLNHYFGKHLKIFDCSIDTKANADFCSYRRDGPQAGRQYSFVVINS